MTDKTFLLVVGAQKAGTTWLHSWLETATGFAAGMRKEYHVWDALTVPEMAHFQITPRRLFKRGEMLFAKGSPFHGKSLPRLVALALWGARLDPAQSNLAAMRAELHDNPQWLRAKLQRNPDAYFAHFAALLAAPDAKVAADITPSYAGLPVETLRTIRDGMLARGIKIKVIFLMRDPVSRCFSQARMKAASYRARGMGSDSAQDWLQANFNEGVMHFRSDYPTVVGNLRQVFQPEEIYIDLYETLFTPAGQAALEAFVGLPLDPALRDTKVREGRPDELTDDLARRVAKEYHFVYDWAAREFPQVRDLWQGYALLD